MKTKFKKSIAFIIVFAMILSGNIGAYTAIAEGDNEGPEGTVILEEQLDQDSNNLLGDQGASEPPTGDEDGMTNQEGLVTDPILVDYVINYLEEGTNKILSEQKIVSGKALGEEIIENAIEIEGYDIVKPASSTLILEQDGNEITFYYTLTTMPTMISSRLSIGIMATGNYSIPEGVIPIDAALNGDISTNKHTQVRKIWSDNTNVYFLVESTHELALFELNGVLAANRDNYSVDQTVTIGTETYTPSLHPSPRFTVFYYPISSLALYGNDTFPIYIEGIGGGMM